MAIVAAVAAEHGIPFVCVPAGTRNHFALDLGVARRDLIGALDAFTDGLERHVDLGEVNRRVFVNNVSIGIYGDAVQQTGYRDAKARTLLETAREVLGPTAAAPGIRLLDDLGRTHADPAVVLVSNNPYAIDQPLACGTRPRLDGGQLGVVVLDRPTEAKRPQATAWSTRSVDVQSPSRVNLGIDGEAVTLESPLRFAVRARALRVRISARHPGVSPSALAPPLPRRAPKT
jgi:diacylglycerol kinase family enzyme